MPNLPPTESTNRDSRTRFFKRYENDPDEQGFDLAPYTAAERCIHLVFKKWFDVQIAGLENIPATGSAMLFGNHSGVLPLDGLLLYIGIINYHPDPRGIHFLVTKFLLDAPTIGAFLRGFGAIPPEYETAKKLLLQQELIFIYPEAEKGTGKLFKNRYKLEDFHSGFVRGAIETGAPLIPIVTIGGEEIYPLFGNIKPLAKLLNAPYFPMTPFFPWLPFPFSVTPLPVKLMMAVCQPFKLKYPPEAADDEDLVAEISKDIQNDIQAKVNDLLEIRTSPFKKWNMEKVNAYLKSRKCYSPSVERHRHPDSI